MGTSKGGTAAIYYGLIIKASTIIAGACQYNLGNYLTSPGHLKIFYAMMGGNAGQYEKETLNLVMPTLLEEYSRENSTTEIQIIYSKHEHTYKDDIIDLLKKLNEYHFNVKEVEYSFTNHNDVGIYFKKYINEYFINRKQGNRISHKMNYITN